MKSQNKRQPIINISKTKYRIVQWIAQNILNWEISREEEDRNSDIYWQDQAVMPDKLTKMLQYQKINHFPGMYALARKNCLASNLNKLQKYFPSSYNFFPKTWIMPIQQSDFIGYYKRFNQKSYIVKPEASCQGKGIFLLKRLDDLIQNDKYIIQEYIDQPLLINGLKFDIRLYVFVNGINPLRIFIHKEGLVRFATSQYQKPSFDNKEDIYMHLTNYAINKNSENFVKSDQNHNEKSHKWKLSALWTFLGNQGVNTASIWDDIGDIVIKTLLVAQPSLHHTYKSCQPQDNSNNICFEILGFDILLDSDFKPWLLEINHSPSFTVDSPLDQDVKSQIIKDALILLNIDPNQKSHYIKRMKDQIQQRTITGISLKPTKEDREKQRLRIDRLRDNWEIFNSGGYIKLYPPIGGNTYLKFLNKSIKLWVQWTEGKQKRNANIHSNISQESSQGSTKRKKFLFAKRIRVKDKSVQRKAELNNNLPQKSPKNAQKSQTSMKVFPIKNLFDQYAKPKLKRKEYPVQFQIASFNGVQKTRNKQDFSPQNNKKPQLSKSNSLQINTYPYLDSLLKGKFKDYARQNILKPSVGKLKQLSRLSISNGTPSRMQLMQKYGFFNKNNLDYKYNYINLY